MGKLVSNASSKESGKHSLRKDEEFPIFVHALLVVLSCFSFPLISKFALVPYLTELFGKSALVPVGTSDVNLMLIMLSMLLLLPISFTSIYKKDKRRIVPVYMAGENTGNNESFYSAAGGTRKVEFRNWYMEDSFGSKKLEFWSNIACIIVLGTGIILLIGGLAK
jgi:ech hydrogenase subunit A